MSNLQTSISRDIATWKNAVKMAKGDKELAKDNLTKAIFDFTRIISRRVFQNGFKVSPEYAVIKNLDAANGFERERIAVIVQTGGCFAINTKGDIYSITENNKYGFKKLEKKRYSQFTGRTNWLSAQDNLSPARRSRKKIKNSRTKG